MDISNFLSDVCNLNNALTILEGQFNDHENELPEKYEELDNMVDMVKNDLSQLRSILHSQSEELQDMSENIHKLRDLKSRAVYVLSQEKAMPEVSHENNPTKLFFEQTYSCSSPIPSSWVQMASPPPSKTPQTQKKIQPSIELMKCVTESEMKNVPKYMKGRFTAEAVNHLVDSFNTTMKKKYETIRLAKKNVKPKDLDYYIEWKREENTEPKGTRFITVNDLNNFGNMKMDKASYNIITILRHLKRVKENRPSGSQIHYIIL